MHSEGDERVEIAAAPPRRHLANATLFMLARNSDIDSAMHSVREVEDRFNHKYGYPWVFLNEQQFSDDFKRCAQCSYCPDPDLTDRRSFPWSTHSRVSNLASGSVHFGRIPDEHWYQPDWVNETLAEEERDKMVSADVIYGGSVRCDLSSYPAPVFQW